MNLLLLFPMGETVPLPALEYHHKPVQNFLCDGVIRGLIRKSIKGSIKQFFTTRWHKYSQKLAALTNHCLNIIHVWQIQYNRSIQTECCFWINAS